MLSARIWFSIGRRYAPAPSMESMRVLVVEDEPYMAEAIRDGLRLEAIAADIAGDGDTALELLSSNAYDIAVLDRDIPGPSGDEIAESIVASGSGMPILMLTAADRLDDKTTGFELGADDHLTKPFELQELVLRLRALDRGRGHHRPPVREIAGLRLDPFRREVYRDGRYVPLTRKQFAVLEVLVAAEGGIVSAEELLAGAWDENADPFTNAPRITVSGLRKRRGVLLPFAWCAPWCDLHSAKPRRPPALFRSDRSRRDGVPAGVRAAGRVDSRRPHARSPDSHHRRDTRGRERIALPPDPSGRPQGRVPRARRQLRHHARAARSTRRRTAEIRSQRLPRTAHPAGDHADTPRRGAQRSKPRQRRTCRPPPRRQHPSDRPHRSIAPAQPRRPTVLHPRTRRPVAHSRRSHRNAPPPRRTTRRHHRDLRRRDPHHRLTRPPAADGYEPRAQRDRPQSA